VISEEECVLATLAHHDRTTAEKFLQELLWRTYWKGWLELRPAVWTEYINDVRTLSAQHENNESYQRAIIGDTHLSFFNDWISELVTTGYLHNHTRMWFASTWVFTLRLPWQLGARFMYHHLLDGDPASNTLSWRWVAGLHTPGKIYLARPENVGKYSEGRWEPRTSELCGNPAIPSYKSPPPQNEIPAVCSQTPSAGSLIMLTDDDLSADLSSEFTGINVHYCIFAPTPREASKQKGDLVAALRADTADRVKGSLVSSSEDLASVARRFGVNRVHTMMPRVGFERDEINRTSTGLADQGISLVYHRRSWEAHLMPLAHSGFFKFWERVKSSL
jgi:deoxyribodipyrimidine photo-lyase